MPSLEHGNAGAETGRFEGDRKAGEPGADDANVGIQIERKPLAVTDRRRGVRSGGRAGGRLVHIVFLRIDRALVTLP